MRDTFIIHTKASKRDVVTVEWKYAISQKSNVCYGEVQCVKFNPKVGFLCYVATEIY